MCSKRDVVNCVTPRRPSTVDTISSTCGTDFFACSCIVRNCSTISWSDGPSSARPPAGAIATTDSARPRAASLSAM
jgi:hypothetical protein